MADEFPVPRFTWDDYDLAHGLRDRMALLVAEIVSGVEDPIPEQADYDLADALRREIEDRVMD